MASLVKCLVVDDLEENLFALSSLLRMDDLEVLTAKSGKEALELLLSNDFALAFVDVQMPEMDGFELAELMRGTELTRDIPIIFLTAGARDYHRFFKGYEIGAVDFLYKPVEPKILQNKARTFVQLHRQKQQLASELARRTETLRFSEMFTAMLGHDLRNPLQAIITSAQFINYQSENDKARDAAARIISSGQWMSRMIIDLLDLAQARLGGGIHINRRQIDLLEVIQQVIGELRISWPGRQIIIEHTGEFVGKWDADRIAQIAGNLIGNALKHGYQNGKVIVELDGKQTDRVLMRVKNTGAIPSKILPHIFDPFRGYQRDTTPNRGLGLGLYIVQQLVLAHNGSVQVESGDDQTCFEISLPRVPIQDGNYE